MSLNFLADLASSANPFGSSGLSSGLLGGLAAAAIGILILIIVIFFALYFYTGFAFMAIGRKAKLKSPGVAWVTFLATLFEASDSPWWPLPVAFVGLILGFIISTVGILSPVAQILGGIITFISVIFLAVILIMWHWKTFEAVGKPGWLILIPVILAIIGFLCLLVVIVMPLLALLGGILLIIAAIIYLVLIGIAAWSK